MKKNTFQICIIIFAVLFMAIGYASINSVSLSLDGKVVAILQDEVFITDIEYVPNDTVLLGEEVKIKSFYSTIVNSELNLANAALSTVKLKITVFNSANEDYVFVGTFFEKDFYDNENITFELSGLKIDDVVKKGDYLSFYVTFKYKDFKESEVNETLLLSTIDYRFEPYSVKDTISGIEFNYLLKNSVYAPEGDVYEYYSVDANRAVDNTVKIIVFGKTSDYINEVSGIDPEPIDIYGTGSISMYRMLLSDGMYKIYILSDSGKFILNPNAAWMFDKLYSLEDIINLHLLDTSNVTNMRDMFCDCASLKNVDLSNFETSKVTNMIGMFARMTVIEHLDLSTFDTSNVTEMGQMFTTDPNLEKIYVSDKWDVSEKVATADGGGVFSNCKKLVGGNGTVYDSSKLTYTMAVVDGTKAGYLTNGYKLDTGINVNHVIKNKTSDEIAAWTLSNRYEDTNITSLTFGQTRDYNSIVSNYDGVAVDSDGSGVISVYRIPNGSNYDVYILSNSGLFEANADSAWLFDKLLLLKEINNLNLLDTSNVTNMRDMFCDVQTITSLDLSNFNTSKATTFEGMFARMYNVSTLDLSSFNTSKLTSVNNMIVLSISSTETYKDYMNVIPKLTTIYVSDKWNVSHLSNQTMFANTVNLVGGNGTKFDSTKSTAQYAVVDTPSSVGYFTLKE